MILPSGTLPPTVLEWSRGDAFLAKLLTPDALDAAIAAYLADPSKPAVLDIGDKRLDVAAAVVAHQWSAEELAVEDATPARRRNTVKTAVLLALVELAEGVRFFQFCVLSMHWLPHSVASIVPRSPQTGHGSCSVSLGAGGVCG